ncbi:RNA polymerase sigma factor [Anaerotruncus rubiinfantis]|uniref:RNA polymerase sigma factor n=1 Tax=Anaerotruncus rubiinfantis TaxID=1720200 RepID=UPI003D78CB3C
MIFFLIQAIEDDFDRSRLSNLYIKHQALFLSKSKKIIQDPYAAEDVLQDAMIRVIGRIHTLRTLSEAQMVAYIVKAIQSCAIDYCRKVKRKPVFEDIEDHTELTDACDIMEHIDQQEMAIRLGAVLSNLPQRDQDILLYKYIMEYENTQIAQMLEMKPESVRMALTRARRRVKEFWKEEGNDIRYPQTIGQSRG